MAEPPRDEGEENPEFQGENEALSVEYKKDENYTITPVTGVRGGQQSGGGFKFDFMLDLNEVPEKDVYRLTSAGDFEFAERHGGTNIERVLQTGIYGSEDTVIEIALFMLGHALDVEFNALARMLEENIEDFEPELDETANDSGISEK